MISIRPLDPAATSALSRAVSDLRQRIDSAAQEAVTGRHADQTAALDGRIGFAMLGQKALEGVAEHRLRLSARETRLDVTQRSLSVVQDSISGIGARALGALGRGPTADLGNVARDAENALDTMFRSLNARAGERFLFAGDAVSTQPFGSAETLIADVAALADAAADPDDFEARLDAYFEDPAGGWRTNIYAGVDTASDGESVTGATPALVDAARALSLLALADERDGPAVLKDNPDILQDAASRLGRAEDALIGLRADIGATQGAIEQEKEALDVEETIITRTFNSLTARDPFEAATELRELETNLQASYALTSRLANLSLLNFLG